jgi:hypothetical protein
VERGEQIVAGDQAAGDTDQLGSRGHSDLQRA